MDELTSIDQIKTQLLEKMPEILEKGIEYGGDLFNRFIQYAIFIEIASILISLAVSIILTKLLLKRAWSKEQMDKKDIYDSDFYMFTNMILCALVLVPWTIFLSSIYSLFSIDFKNCFSGNPFSK